MRFLLPLVVMMLTACSQPQPGCTAENCRLLTQACRVEFVGGPAALAICTGFDRPPGPVDYTPYCVNACNAHPGNGQLASCIAAKADACRDAGIRTDLVIAPCLDQMGKSREKACDDRCLAEQKTCDDACSGGRPCDNCIRSGGSNCASVCTDAGYKACLDCSGQCGLQYIACSDRCPFAP